MNSAIANTNKQTSCLMNGVSPTSTSSSVLSVTQTQQQQQQPPQNLEV
jgi:hypothetical protein